MFAPGSIAELGFGAGWGPREAIAMIWAYYDESGEYVDNKLVNMSVGVCVSKISGWCKFDPVWRSAMANAGLEGHEFKTADFQAWRHPFDFKLENGERDKERHNRLLNSLLDAMLNNIEWFAGFSISSPIPPDGSSAHHYALEDCIAGAVTHAVHDLWEHYKQPINLVFDQQEHFGLTNIQKIVDIYNWGDGKGRLNSTMFGRSDKLSPLQAADLLAYEMSKRQRDWPVRYPFDKLVDGCKQRNLPLTLKWGPFR